jgi:hypothetical protein
MHDKVNAKSIAMQMLRDSKKISIQKFVDSHHADRLLAGVENMSS